MLNLDDDRDRPDDTWNLISQEVDETHKELVNGFLSEENLIDVVRYFYKQLKDSSLVEAIAQVAVTHGLEEKTVRKNYFHGGSDES